MIAISSEWEHNMWILVGVLIGLGLLALGFWEQSG